MSDRVVTVRKRRPWFSAKLAKSLETDVVVAAGDDGLPAGTLQEVLQALATRIEAVED